MYLEFFFSYYCLQRYSKLFEEQGKKYLIFISSYILCWIIECIYSWANYNQDISSILGTGGRLLFLVYFVPFLVLFIRDNGPEQFLKIINLVTLIWAIIIAVQSIVYKNSGTIIFDLKAYFLENTGEEIKLLNNSIRITLFSFGNLMIVYNFYVLYSKKAKEKINRFSLICLIVGLYSMIVVQQTRMYIMVIALCFAVIILSKKENWKSQLLKIVFIVCVVWFVLYSPLFNEFISSFSTTGDNKWSTQARLYAVSYYWECFNIRPIFGNGFLSDANYSSIIRGSLGLAHYSDVGLLGLVAETGLFSIFFYIIPVIIIIKNIIKLKKNDRLNSFDLAVLAYIIATSLTLILTVNKYSYTFAFIFAYFEYRVYYEKDSFSYG